MRDSIIAQAEKHRGLFGKKRNGSKWTEYILETAPNLDEHRLSVLFEVFPELEPPGNVLVMLFLTRFRRGAFVDDQVPFESAFPGHSKNCVMREPDFLFEDLQVFFLTETGLPCYLDWHLRGHVHLGNHVPYEELAGIKRYGNNALYIRLNTGMEVVWSPSIAFLEAFFGDLFTLLKYQGKITG